MCSENSNQFEITNREFDTNLAELRKFHLIYTETTKINTTKLCHSNLTEGVCLIQECITS